MLKTAYLNLIGTKRLGYCCWWMLKTIWATYHTNACCKPEYAIRGIIRSILWSLRGAIMYFNIAPNEECAGALFPLSSLLDSKHIKTMPTIMQPRNTTNSRFLPVTLPPSWSDMGTRVNKMKSTALSKKQNKIWISQNNQDEIKERVNHGTLV
jgi:hypothetical protein